MGDLLSVVFLGLVVGSIYALTAFGLVLTYRTSGVFNFAHGAVGMFFAYVFFQLTQGGRVNFVVTVYRQAWTLPTPVAMVLVVGVLAPAFGWGLDVALFRRLRSAPSVVKIVATIGVLITLYGLAGVLWGASTTLVPRSIFPQHTFAAAGVRAGTDEIATIAITVGLAIGMLTFLRASSLGVRMRAVVDRPDVAELMGVDSGWVSATAWMIGTGFAALAGILLVPFFGSLDPQTLSFLVVTATAAAVVGRLESLPLTLVGGFGIGIAQFVVQRYTSGDLSRQLQPSIPFIVLFVVLMLPIAFREIDERASFPIVRRAVGRARAPAARLLTWVAILAAFVAVPMLVGGDWQAAFATVPPMALLFLSLVLLSGHAGQISLSQAGFAGVGAFVAAHLVVDHHWPFFVAALAGGLAAVPVGALLAARAARLPPLFLGFATLAFGAVMDQVAFTSQGFSNGLAGIAFDRPGIVSSPLAFYLAGAIAFAIFAVLVANLRRGRTGLALAAMRDSQVGVESLGTSVARLKFTAFCVSAFIAGIAGALLAAALGRATSFSFFEIQSLLVLALAVIGGVGVWQGAVIGAVMFQLSAPLLHQSVVERSWIAKTLLHGQLEALLPVLFGLGAIGLARQPLGVVEQVRDGAARARALADRTRAIGRRIREGATSTAPAASALAETGGGEPAARFVTFAGASLYHRPACVLTTGKAPLDAGADGAHVLDALRPCPVCADGAGLRVQVVR